MKIRRLSILLIILFVCSSCTNIKNSWVNNCDEQKKFSKALISSMPGMDVLHAIAGGDKFGDAAAQIDCKVFAETQSPVCEKKVEELSGNLKTGMYEQCMTWAMGAAVGALALKTRPLKELNEPKQSEETNITK